MEPRIDWAKRKAIVVLQDLEIHCAAQLVDLERLCHGRGVAIRAESLRNFEGLLIRQKRLIVYRSTIPEEGRRRFTIAHELGHWELHPDLDQLQACTTGDIHAYRGSRYELEANAFAGELLMPKFMLAEQLRYAAPTMATVKRLATHYSMTLTASAVRLAEHTHMPVFVAFSADQRLKWYVRSEKAKPYFFKAIDSELDEESLARTCLDGPDDAMKPIYVESEAWFPDDCNRSAFRVLEQSVELGDYGVTLSIITVDD